MEFNTKKIIWDGPAYYQEYRDRRTLDFVWVPVKILPEHLQINPQDGVYFKAVLPDFEPIKYFAVTETDIYSRNGKERKYKVTENTSRCPAFGWGYSAYEKACKQCKISSIVEWKKCKKQTSEIVDFLRNSGWIELGNCKWQHPENGTRFNTHHAKLIAEVQEEKKKKIRENPFTPGTKSAIIFEMIENGIGSRKELYEKCRMGMPGKDNPKYIKRLVCEWKRDGIKKTNLILVEDEKGMYFKEKEQENVG